MSEDIRPRRALGSRYELLEVLGRGAMGEVWRVWDRAEQIYRAAKLLHPGLAEDAEIVARFVQERSVLLGLRHPGVVEVCDFVVEGRSVAIVMELLDGPSLRAVLDERGPLRPEAAIVIVSQVLDALSAAHGIGIVHCDVKPDNVMVVRDGLSVRLADFGIARLVGGDAVGGSGSVGTPPYMAPELVSHGVVCAGGDVYAAGTMLYEMCAGHTPYEIGQAQPLDIGPRVWRVIASMLAADPGSRPSAARAASELRAAVASPEVGGAERRRSRGSAPLTILKGVPSVPVAPAVVGGTVVGLLANSGSHGGQTRIGSRGTPQASEPVVEVTEGCRLVRRVVVGVGVLALILGLVVVSGEIARAGFAAADPKPSSGAVVQTAPVRQTWPVGLSLSATASYREGKLTLSLELAYAYPILGALLVVVPPITDVTGTCEVGEDQWSSAATARQVEEILCGYELHARESASALAVSLTRTVTRPPTQPALTQWMEAVLQRTRAALEQLSHPEDFALQALKGLEVRDVRREGAAYAYEVAPLWVGMGSRPAAAPLYRSSDLAQVRTSALQALLGLPGLRPFSSVVGTAPFISTDSQQNCPVDSRTQSVAVAVEGAVCRITATVAALNSRGPTS